MKPSQKYAEFLQLSGFRKDPVQQHGLYLLDRLHDEICQKLHRKADLTLFSKWFSKDRRSIKGLYLWGGVGRGKTFLMDIFYQGLPIKNKKRVHFHQFMKNIHDELSNTDKKKNPIEIVARIFASKTQVLCLDEFVVTDIGDAMLIGGLLEALFQQGVIIVATSNIAPEALYQDGLQRANFEPAIDLILHHCHVSNLDGGEDYRTLGLRSAGIFQYPHDEAAVESLNQYFKTHQISDEEPSPISINGRQIPYVYCAEDTIWFNFSELCKTARSRLDYLEIAQQFNTLVLTGIEQMNNHSNDVAKRFISLIDVLYDHQVKLICTAEVCAQELYPSGFLEFEFQRTSSRLLEMQSSKYLGKSHRVY